MRRDYTQRIVFNSFDSSEFCCAGRRFQILDKLAFQPSHLVIAAPAPPPELTLREVGMMLTRRRAIIYVSLCAFFLLAILALAASTRRYRSMGEIEVQKESTSALGIQTDSADTPSDALEVNMIIQTQAQILQSDSLALRVIEDLHLEQTEDYRPKWSPVGWLFGLLGPRGVADSRGATLENSPHRRMRVLQDFSSPADSEAGGRNALNRRGLSKSRSAARGSGREPPAARLD